MQLNGLLASLVLLTTTVVHAQESSNQNQSDTLVNKIINLPLMTTANQTFCSQYIPYGSSQWEWMFDLVYRAFSGQYTPLANASTYQAQGILNASAYYRDPVGNTSPVNLLKYFDGSLASSNRCGKPTAVQYVTGNGTYWYDPEKWLKIQTTPAMFAVISHLTSYLGAILGCDSPSFPPYTGLASQFKVHRFMGLKSVEMHYFIHNIYDSALSSNVSQPDGIIIGTALDNMFNKLCAPPKVISSNQPAELQNMCLDNSTCASWVLGNSTCSSYRLPRVGVAPASAHATASSTIYQGVLTCAAQCEPTETW